MRIVELHTLAEPQQVSQLVTTQTCTPFKKKKQKKANHIDNSTSLPNEQMNE